MKRDATQRAVHRIRIIKGLLEKMEQGIIDDKYCVEVLNRSVAIQRALKSLDAHLLEHHLECCFKDQMKGNKRSQELREELLELYKLSRKTT